MRCLVGSVLVLGACGRTTELVVADHDAGSQEPGGSGGSAGSGGDSAVGGNAAGGNAGNGQSGSGGTFSGGSGGTFSGGFGGGGAGGNVLGGSGGGGAIGGKAGGAGLGGSGALGGGGGTAGGGPSSALGARCSADFECGNGLFCLTNFGDAGERLPGGLCTLPCDPSQLDLDCNTFEAGALCVGFSNVENYCMEGCVLHGDVGCSDRTDVFCVDLATPGSSIAVPVCVPFCSNDEQCSQGVCNHETGGCSSTRDPGTLPLGAPCTPPTSQTPPPDQCAEGACIALASSAGGICTALCRGDILPQCGWDGQAPPSALCLQPAGAGLLEVGTCRRGCDCNDDCGHPGMLCYAEPQLEQFGALGYCVEDDGSLGIACQ